jgi:hypothetical protein
MPRETRSASPPLAGLGDTANDTVAQKMGFSAKKANIGRLGTPIEPFGSKIRKDSPTSPFYSGILGSGNGKAQRANGSYLAAEIVRR